MAKLKKCCREHSVSLGTQLVRSLPTMQETWVGQEYPPEREGNGYPLHMPFWMIFHFHYSGSHHHWFAAAVAKWLQSCLTLWPRRRQHTRLLCRWDSPGKNTGILSFPSPVHARTLSRFSRVLLCVTPWTAAHQAPLSTGFSRQEFWRGLPFPPHHWFTHCWIQRPTLQFSFYMICL